MLPCCSLVARERVRIGWRFFVLRFVLLKLGVAAGAAAQYYYDSSGISTEVSMCFVFCG